MIRASKKPDFVFINNSMETFTPTESGAIATHIWELCRVAQQDSLDPLVISIRCGALPYEAIPLSMVDSPRVPKNRVLFKMLRAQRKLAGWRYVRQDIHARRVARAIRGAGVQDVPFILHNDPELAVLLRKKFPRAFIVHHFHNPLECSPRFRAAFPGAVDVITGVSGFIARWAEQYFGLEKESVKTIYNGVDAGRFARSGDGNRRTPVINFVGRTGIEKAPDLILHAARRIARTTRPFSVQILGSNHWQKFEWDDYQRELRDLSGDLEREGVSVRWPGHVSRANLPAEFNKADIHVVPSRWDEPCALTLLEGMASGLAVVASRTGGSPELLGDAGFLFDRDSVDGLAKHLSALVMDRDLRLSAGLKARARAKEFTWQKTWAGFREAAKL